MEDFIQAKNLIEGSQNILILPSREINGDVLASSLALFSTLKKLGKNVNVLIDEVPEKFKFLDGWQSKTAEDFVVSINTAGKEISKMRYERNDGELRIFLALSKGELKSGDVSFPIINQPLSLLVTIGIKSLADIEGFLKQNARFLSEALILNIDNHSANENFGEVSMVSADSSLAEILTGLIRFMESEDEAFLDENIATYLLTGIICASQNFRNPRTEPKTFKTSAFLIERGGNHQKIIRHLYKQKSISQVNLLGRILEKLNFNEPKELYSASLTEKDFQECQASSKDLGFVIEELKFSFRYLPNLLILWKSHASPTAIKGIFYSAQKELAEKILQNYQGISRGDGVLFLIKETDLDSAKENLLKII